MSRRLDERERYAPAQGRSLSSFQQHTPPEKSGHCLPVWLFSLSNVDIMPLPSSLAFSPEQSGYFCHCLQACLFHLSKVDISVISFKSSSSTWVKWTLCYYLQAWLFHLSKVDISVITSKPVFSIWAEWTFLSLPLSLALLDLWSESGLRSRW